MIHLRVIAPAEQADQAIALMRRSSSVTNLVAQRGVALEPAGDVISCDVAEEDASLIVGDLRRLGIAESGSIDIERLDATVSRRAAAAEHAARGAPGDAVIWEHVARQVSDQGYLSWGLVALFSLSGVIAAIAILIDSAPIVVGAMAVSPDFAPLAAFAIGTVRLRADIAGSGFLSLVLGFTCAIALAGLTVELLKRVGVAPSAFSREGNALATSIAAPDAFSVVVALCAGAAGMLSVTLGRSSALVGVAISITTIPAAADIGLSTAYGDWEAFGGSGRQLALNVAGLLIASTVTLALQRVVYRRRLARHRALMGRGEGLDGVGDEVLPPGRSGEGPGAG
ncbi:MAG: DUF389 domain-containing protein [Solirubrobacteraceae bacterium]|nr:DUF389 domain-containing protein [Solirubrobacteraceae bacterium]